MAASAVFGGVCLGRGDDPCPAATSASGVRRSAASSAISSSSARRTSYTCGELERLHGERERDELRDPRCEQLERDVGDAVSAASAHGAR